MNDFEIIDKIEFIDSDLVEINLDFYKYTINSQDLYIIGCFDSESDIDFSHKSILKIFFDKNEAINFWTNCLKDIQKQQN